MPPTSKAVPKDLGITYPVAMDNNLSTWTNYRNRYWPAEHLIDATGTVRHTKFGEGDYDVTENLIRQLLTDANPGVKLPPPSDLADTTPQVVMTPETYLSVGKVANCGGTGTYEQGDFTFAYPPTLPDDAFALQGLWTLDYQSTRPSSAQPISPDPRTSLPLQLEASGLTCSIVVELRGFQPLT